jgi:serpin B
MARLIMTIILLVALMLGISMREHKGAIVYERDASPVIGGNNQFAIDIFDAMRSRPGNVALSPASLSNALAMTYEGARGQTAEEIARVFHFPADRAAMRSGYHDLLARMNGDGSPRPYQLSAANSLWGQQGDPFLPEYQALVTANYGASLNSVDFRRDVEGARQAINTWVDGKTNHLIPELIKSSALDRTTSLVLVNTVYFKADWQSPFKKDRTTPADFLAAPGRKVTVPMMRQTSRLSYADAEGDGVQVLQMPYKGGDHAMIVVLPREADGLDKVEKGLTKARLDGWIVGLKPEEVAVELPRFKLNVGVELSKPLAKLGMPTAFGPSADFSGIDGKRSLFISSVVHQVVIDVNEEGTEAAAATGVIMKRSMAVQVKPPIPFRADHPFLYLIRDVKTGAILFLGRVSDPTS